MSTFYEHKFFIALLFFTTLLLSPGITSSFSSDDYIHLLNNSNFTSTYDILKIFTEPYGREYRPMVRLSLWGNSLMSHDAIPFKITNLVLHLISTALIYTLLLRLGFKLSAALIGASLFALHPIHITNIHFILGRTDLVLAVFYFSTLVIVSQWKDKISSKQMLLTCLFFTLSMLSKEMWISLPVSMLLILLAKQERLNWPTVSVSALRIAPFFIVSVLYLVIRVNLWSQQPDHIAVYTDYGLMNLVKNFAYWLFGLLYPFDLYYAQDLMLSKPAAFILWFSLAILLIAITLAYLLHPHITNFLKSRWILFSLCWFVITLAPISGGYAHRWYLYIPSFCLIILAAAISDKISNNTNKRHFTVFFLTAIIAIYSIESFRLSLIWKKQSEFCMEFLRKIKDLNIDKEKEIYFVNTPFGYKSAYLFTHNSLQEAIQYYFGRSPTIHVINYINLDDENPFSSTIENGKMHFDISPNHYRFMLINANERRFKVNRTFNIGGSIIDILNTDRTGKAIQFNIYPSTPTFHYNPNTSLLLKF